MTSDTETMAVVADVNATSESAFPANPTTTLAFLPRSTSKKFPFKCHEMLSYAERQGLDDVVAWLPGGKGFIIHDQDQFCKRVLRETFNHNNYKSFEKQCGNWMYKREVTEKGAKIFSHPNFLRGRKSLCQSMTSKSTRSKKSEVVAKKTSSEPKIKPETVAQETPTLEADDRSASLVAALAQAVVSQQQQSPVAAAASRLELRNRLAAVAASSPAAANALMNALQKRVAAKSAIAAAAVAAAAPPSNDLAVVLAKAAVHRSAALERLQLQQEFQRQQQALLLEQQKVEAEHQQQYEAHIQLLLAAHQKRQEQLQQQHLQKEASKQISVPAPSATTFLQEIVKDRKEQEERAAALLALRVPR
ncbi:HSF-type DNA-binding protein [Nitzschia inconspicua]|uniref:HSF-type DNA-binding protein n=1 Tax=Nitzschia inconspicua TaxID=303405 RepID=A0A9K3M0F0_9STRA|nr:HSF-type DNA-binding protein [Nitzschia inconspicua]